MRPHPELGVLEFGSGQMAQNLGAHGLCIALSQGEVGVVGLHLGVPVFFEGGQDFFKPGAA